MAATSQDIFNMLYFYWNYKHGNSSPMILNPHSALRKIKSIVPFEWRKVFRLRYMHLKRCVEKEDVKKDLVKALIIMWNIFINKISCEIQRTKTTTTKKRRWDTCAFPTHDGKPCHAPSIETTSFNAFLIYYTSPSFLPYNQALLVTIIFYHLSTAPMCRLAPAQLQVFMRVKYRLIE